MGKRTNIKYLGRCMMTKIFRKGQSVRVTLKCPKISKVKFENAQELINNG